MASKPDLTLVLDQPTTAIEVQPGTWNVFTPWRTGMFGLLLHGERDQVMEHFNQGLKEQYVRELRYWATNVIVDRQPESGPRP